MEYITQNEKTILAWYKKQCIIENIKEPAIPPNFEKMGMLEQPNPIAVKLAERHLGSTAIFMKVIPMLYRNCCHNNVMLMLRILNQKSKKYVGVFGYNITGCDCGKLYCVEIHSVLKHIESNTYIDLTRDFGGLTEKFFIPVEEYDTSYRYQVCQFKNECADMTNFGVPHCCMNIDWFDSAINRSSWKKIKEMIEYCKNMTHIIMY